MKTNSKQGCSLVLLRKPILKAPEILVIDNIFSPYVISVLNHFIEWGGNQ
jgi:hypothetical protein